jgi:hypothetical protein
MNDDFGITVGIKAMAVALEGSAQLGEVIDFAIEYDPYGAVFVMDRLLSGTQVDDAEPAHAKPHPALRINAFVIGAAMHDRLAHAAHFGRIGHIITICAGNARYSAHNSKLVPRRGSLRITADEDL